MQSDVHVEIGAHLMNQLFERMAVKCSTGCGLGDGHCLLVDFQRSEAAESLESIARIDCVDPCVTRVVAFKSFAHVYVAEANRVVRTARTAPVALQKIFARIFRYCLDSIVETTSGFLGCSQKLTYTATTVVVLLFECYPYPVSS